MGLELEYTEGQTPIDEEEKEGLKIKTISTEGIPVYVPTFWFHMDLIVRYFPGELQILPKRVNQERPT